MTTSSEQGNHNSYFLIVLFIALSILAVFKLHNPPILFQTSNAQLFVSISMIWAIIFLLLCWSSTDTFYSRSVILVVILILHTLAVLCLAHSEN